MSPRKSPKTRSITWASSAEACGCAAPHPRIHAAPLSCIELSEFYCIRNRPSGRDEDYSKCLNVIWSLIIYKGANRKRAFLRVSLEYTSIPRKVEQVYEIKVAIAAPFMPITGISVKFKPIFSTKPMTLRCAISI